MDCFEWLPDQLILLIFNRVSDIKTLIRCRAVSKRFNSLVPHTESLLLKVDCIISSDSDGDCLILTFLKSILKSLHHLFKPTPIPTTHLHHNSPPHILSRFHRIRHLQIELPAGDLKLDKGLLINWRAHFGKTLKTCVILAFRPSPAAQDARGADPDFAGGLKMRVVWTISALIAASARHFLLRDVVREHREMETLVLSDKEGEGTVVMDREGLREFRTAACGLEAREAEASRTVVPSVRMRMRHEPRVRLREGVVAEDATLVVIRPCGSADVEDAEVAMGAFGDGLYGDAVQVLLKSKGYSLEMNSF